MVLRGRNKAAGGLFIAAVVAMIFLIEPMLTPMLPRVRTLPGHARGTVQ
jgi:hypothetical protein